MPYVNVKKSLIIVGLFLLLFGHAIADEPITLFQGVAYIRDERSALRPMIIHVILIDLQTEGIDFFVTPDDELPDYDYKARTTTEFLDKFDVQVAINGDFYGPVRDDGNETESGVNAHGLTIMNNISMTQGFAPPELISTLYVSSQNEVTFNKPATDIDVAISGKYMLLIDGEYQTVDDSEEFVEKPHPRSAIGLSEDGQILILMVIDGRQEGISEGATLPELATFLKEYNAYTALNLDGGGSSSLAMMGEDGEAILLNVPFNYETANVQRPIANHLGVYALALR